MTPRSVTVATARLLPRRVSRRVVGRFRVEGTLGTGGMGDVYRAHDPVLDRQIALKVLRAEKLAPGQEATRMRRVIHEARAAAALTHPNTVTDLRGRRSERRGLHRDGAARRRRPSCGARSRNGFDVFKMEPNAGSKQSLLVTAANPSIAATENRLAVTFAGADRMWMVLYRADLHQVGDPIELHRLSPGASVIPKELPVTIALTDEEATVFYTADAGGKTRLFSTVLRLGETAFSTPRIVIDDALTMQTPIAARLPDGRWALAWVASVGGGDTLRVAVVGKNGELVAPASIFTDAAIVESLHMSSTNDGLALSWRHDAATVKIALATCPVVAQGAR